MDYDFSHRVVIPPSEPFFESLKSNLKETFFPEDPFRQFKNKSSSRKFILGLQYFFPILQWAPQYTFELLRADVIAGITIASLAVPQGISYGNLANLPPIMGLYSSFVPPLVYALLGSSRDLAIGPVAVASILISSMLEKTVNPNENPKLYVQLAITSTFFAGVFQAALGFLRLGFIVELLSHPTIVGFMSGAATVVCLQQLKGILGLIHFTHATDVVSVLRSIFTQTNQWRWQTGVLGCFFLFFLSSTRYLSKKKGAFFWINAMAPLTSVMVGSILVYFTHAEKHHVEVIGKLKKGFNPLSLSELIFGSEYLMTTIKTGVITGIIGLAEGIAVGRSFAMTKNYHIDGNKEMIAFGLMNVAGSFTTCFLTAGPFSRTAVNYNAGCKSAMSNIIMATAVMLTLLFLTPLFHYTPLVVLSSIMLSAMLGLIKYKAAIRLWKVDKIDFVICMGAYLGVVFASIEIGLIIAVTISLLRVLMLVARPKTSVLGNIPNSVIYRDINQYPAVNYAPGVLIIQIDGPIYFVNESYLRERILRTMNEEDDRLKASGETSLCYVILDMSAVVSLDSCGIIMIEEVKRITERRHLKLVLANPQSEVIKKLKRSKAIEKIGEEWIFLTVAQAVATCSFMLNACKSTTVEDEHSLPDDDDNDNV